VSMMGRWIEIAPELLERILTNPSILDEVTAVDLHLPIPPAKASALLELLSSAKLDEMAARMPAEHREAFLRQAAVMRTAAAGGPRAEPEGVRARLDLEKAWHGLHFLLCRTADEAPPPLGSAVLGGAEVGADRGHGPVRYLTPEQAADVALAISSIDPPGLRRAWEPQSLVEHEVYPGGWEQPESLEWLLDALGQLQQFYSGVANRGSAVLLYIT